MEGVANPIGMAVSELLIRRCWRARKIGVWSLKGCGGSCTAMCSSSARREKRRFERKKGGFSSQRWRGETNTATTVLIVVNLRLEPEF
jgi:hypothetical protein